MISHNLKWNCTEREIKNFEKGGWERLKILKRERGRDKDLEKGGRERLNNLKRVGDKLNILKST